MYTSGSRLHELLGECRIGESWKFQKPVTRWICREKKCKIKILRRSPEGGHPDHTKPDGTCRSVCDELKNESKATWGFACWCSIDQRVQLQLATEPCQKDRAAKKQLGSLALHHKYEFITAKQANSNLTHHDLHDISVPSCACMLSHEGDAALVGVLSPSISPGGGRSQRKRIRHKAWI